MKKWKKQVGAWMLVFVMVLSLIMVPAKKVEAAGDITLAVKETYGSDTSFDIKFSGTAAYGSVNGLINAGYTQLVVEYVINSFTQKGTKTPGVLGYYCDPSYNYETGGWKDLDADKKSGTLTYDFSTTSGLNNELLNFGLLVCNVEPSSVTYEITSAKLVKTGEGGESGEPSVPESVEGIVIEPKDGDSNTYYREYKFNITNNTSNAVSSVQIVIPTSTEVSMGYTVGFEADYSASDNGVLVNYVGDIAANGGKVLASEDYKVGFNLNGATVGTPYVKSINSAPVVSNDLKYELTGLKDIPYADTPVGKHGKLHVGKVDQYTAPTIIDENGKTVQLRGASTHGMQWFPGYVNKTAFQTLRDDWGVNLVRLVCYPRDVDPNASSYLNGAKEQLDNLIETGVQATKDLGMYAIVDWHVHAYNPNETLEEAKTFFTTYANKYKDYDHVLYEICNEPTGTNWYNNGQGNDLYTYCTEITKVIRQYDDDAIIICGTNNWSQYVDDVAQKPVDDANAMYTFHFYAGTHSTPEKNRVKQAIVDGTPIFCTEFGTCDASGNTNFSAAKSTDWISFLDQYNISYACWSFCNKAETASYFKSSCSKTEGNWVESDLSKTGVWLINTYREHEEKENENENETDVVPTSITLNKEAVSLEVDGTETLTAKVLPEGANPSVIWTSGTPSVATVSTSGKITAIAPGTTTITVESKKDATIKATCEVTVTKKTLTSVDFPTVSGTVTAGTKLKNVTLSKTSDTYGTFAWVNGEQELTKDTTTVDVKYTLSSEAQEKYQLSSAISSDGISITKGISISVSKAKPTIAGSNTITVNAGTKISEISLEAYSASNAEQSVAGTFSIVAEDKILTALDDGITITVKFEPSNIDVYDVATKQVTLKVNRITNPNTISAPSVSEKTDTSIKLDAVTDAEYGIKSPDSTEYTWSDENEFKNLTPYTTYSVVQRYKQTDIYNTGTNSSVISVTTYLAAADRYTVDLSKLSETNYVEAHNGTITYDIDSKVLKLMEAKDYIITGTNGEVAIEYNNASSVVLKNATAKTVTGENLLIKLEGTNKIDAGITATGDVQIKNANDNASGKLSVNGSSEGAISAKNITLTSGEVVATGSDEAAALKATETISLMGGFLTANAATGVIPIQATKIVVASCQISSDAVTIYSPEPVDTDDNLINWYTVKYYAEDGVNSLYSTSVKKDETIKLNLLDKKSGHIALGWKLNETVYAEGSSYKVTDNVTFIAVYEAVNAYEVDLDRIHDQKYVDAHEGTIAVDGNKVTLKENKEYTIISSGNAGNADDSVSIEVEQEDATVILDAVEISNISAAKDVTVIVKGTASVDASKTEESGIAATGTVTIKADSDTAEDSLTVTGGNGAPAIQGGIIKIESGKVTATGGTNAPGLKADVVDLIGSEIVVKGQGSAPAIDAEEKKVSDAVTVENGKDYKEPSNPEEKPTPPSDPEDPDDTGKPGESGGSGDPTDSEKNPPVVNPPSDGNEPPSGNQNQNTDVTATGMVLKASMKGGSYVDAKGTLQLALKKTMTISASFLPENAKQEEITVTSANPKVVAVSGNKLTAKKVGTTTITVVSASGLQQSFKVKVMKKAVTKIKLKTAKKTIKVGKTTKVKATVTPSKSKASNKVFWKSSNENVATVNASGKVTGKKKGKVKITAIATDGSGKKATVTIQVK